ncbi:MAG TPA: hypothetical protein VFE89_16765 [Beijerinckiaceae bacterium]|jgi:hypothetical protein|nr:hypothetical protein [Beijerinckiaceae bacterium]
MAITDHSPVLAAQSTKSRIGAEGYVLIIGVLAIALYAVLRLIYEPGWHDKEIAMRAAMAAEHAKVCDQLGKSAGTPDRDNCLKVLESLYTTHKETILADSSEI